MEQQSKREKLASKHYFHVYLVIKGIWESYEHLESEGAKNTREKSAYSGKDGTFSNLSNFNQNWNMSTNFSTKYPQI
jgi:hypothetical protein